MNQVYENVKIFGNNAVTAGVLSEKCGPVTCEEDGAACASQAMAELLKRLEGHLRTHYGEGLEKVKQVIRLEGYVFAGPDFTRHSQVLDGASCVLGERFEEPRGRHTRVAVGASSLPNGRAVELSLWVELDSKPPA